MILRNGQKNKNTNNKTIYEQSIKNNNDKENQSSIIPVNLIKTQLYI